MLERQSREHVLSRIRAGVLEWGTVEMLRRHGVGERMDREGHVHTETAISYGGDAALLLRHRQVRRHAQFMSYGQTEIQKDLYAAHDAAGIEAYYEVEDVAFHDVTSDRPAITFTQHGGRPPHRRRVRGGLRRLPRPGQASRSPSDVLKRYEKAYPFGWLGILSETPPLEHLVYANSERGFALARSATRCSAATTCSAPSTTPSSHWTDERFWDELLARFPDEVSSQIVTGPSIEKSIAPLRSFVAEPMRYGNLFLAGDAAHIVPPTGAKGLNLAASDVLLPVARPRPAAATSTTPLPRLLLRDGAAPGVGVGPLLLVDDRPAAPLPRARPRSTSASRRPSSPTSSTR